MGNVIWHSFITCQRRESGIKVFTITYCYAHFMIRAFIFKCLAMKYPLHATLIQISFKCICTLEIENIISTPYRSLDLLPAYLGIILAVIHIFLGVCNFWKIRTKADFSNYLRGRDINRMSYLELGHKYDFLCCLFPVCLHSYSDSYLWFMIILSN